MIGVYTLRKIEFGEELTFDYCCVTEVCIQHKFRWVELFFSWCFLVTSHDEKYNM